MDVTNSTNEFSKQKGRLPFSESGSSRDTKPHCSSSAPNSSWYDGHRRDREHKKVRDRSHDRQSWSSRERDKERGTHVTKVRDSSREEGSRERFREEPQQQQPTYPAYAYGATDPAYIENNRRAALGMMSSYNLFAAMNSSQWAMAPLDGMNMGTSMSVAPSASMSVNPNIDMSANTGANINPYAFMGMPNDPQLFSMMGMGNYGQYGMIGNEGNSVIMGVAKEVIHCSNCVLYPPNPNAPLPTTREKPLGCKTVFVGGLPENTTEEIMREIFERCGEILTVRMSKKNFCHIRFANESCIDKAIYFSGYRIKIENKEDPANTGRLHVDYAQARDDQHDYECQQRTLERQVRHRKKSEQAYFHPPTPPPVVHYSDHEAAVLGEKLRGEESFQQALVVLITWLDRGECNKRNSGYFYSMIQSTNSHVRRLMNEKLKYEDELNKAKAMLKQQMEGILRQFNEISKVFNAASLQKVWDHFTKAQRKNISMWKKQTEEIKNAHVEEVLNDRIEDEMDVSDDDDSLKENEREMMASTQDQFGSKISFEQVRELREENDALRCQLEASQNEMAVVRSEAEQERDLRTRQMQAMREAMQNMQEKIITLTQKRTKDEAELKEFRTYKLMRKDVKDIELGEGSHDRENENMIALKDFKDPDIEIQRDALGFSSAVTSSSNNVFSITAGEAKLIGLICTFLNVHHFGASVDYICSYLQKIDSTVQARDVEALMKKFPSVFKEESTGIGASLEKKWKFCGFA